MRIIEENNYYPFGLKHKGYNNVVSSNGNSTAQKKGFGGKELQDELGLDWYDVSARNYDPALGRWMNLDPLAELMTRHSPYNYAFDNPIYFIDADGMMPTGTGNSEFDDRNKDFNPKDFSRPTVFADASGSNNNSGPGDQDPPTVYKGPGVAVGDNVVNQLDEVIITATSSQSRVRENIAQSAEDNIGSTRWNYDVEKGSFPSGSNKCNLFCYDITTQAGASPGLPNGNSIKKFFGGDGYPPVASQWADPNYSIPNWDVVTTPQRGDVASMAIDYSDATGHVAIVVALDATVGTSSTNNVEKIKRSDWGFRPAQKGKVVFRRYKGASY